VKKLKEVELEKKQGLSLQSQKEEEDLQNNDKQLVEMF